MSVATHWMDRRLVPLAVLVLLAIVGLARAAAITSAATLDPTERVLLITGDVLACLALLADAALLYEISRVVGYALGGESGRRRLSWLVVVALAVSLAGYLSRARAEADPYWPEVGVAAAGMVGLLVTARAAAGKVRILSGLSRIPLPLWLAASAAGSVAAVLATVPLARRDGTPMGSAIHGVPPILGLCLLGLLAAVPAAAPDATAGVGGRRRSEPAVPSTLLAMLAAAAAFAMVGLTRDVSAAAVLFAGGLGIASFRPGSPEGDRPPAVRVARYLGAVLAAGMVLWLLVGLLATVGGRSGSGHRAGWDAPAGDGTYVRIARDLGLGPAGAVVVAGVVVLLLAQLARCARLCRDDMVGRWAVGVTCALAAQAVLALVPLGVAVGTSVAAPLLGPDAMSYAVTLMSVGLVFGASCRDGAPAATTPPDTTAPLDAQSAGQLAAGGRP